jgi:hypothetical protein
MHAIKKVDGSTKKAMGRPEICVLLILQRKEPRTI